MEIVHTPVLLKECLFWLSPEGESYEHDAFMIDSTLGEGGHTNAFLQKYPSLRVMGLDADSTIQARAKERLRIFGDRVQFFNGWFNDFYANYPSNLPRPNIILFDLGISVFHYVCSGRGFSFQNEEPLDMRLNPDGEKTAADLVNQLPEEKLADLIYIYSEEKYSRRIARAIVQSRQAGRIESAKALADIIYNAVPSKLRYGKIHPATKTFQALRIAVNKELIRLPQALFDAFAVLQPGGKLGVITFHSLEDHIVKNFFRNLGKQCVCPPEYPNCICGGSACAQLLTKKPVGPSDEEIIENSPSRSAKLRVVKKIHDASKLHLIGVEGI